MRNTILRSAAICSFIVLAGLAGAYVVSSQADALDLSGLQRAGGNMQFLTSEPAAADQQIVGEDLRKLARQAMNDLIASGRHGQN